MAESLCARDSFIETPVDLLAYATEPHAVEEHEPSGCKPCSTPLGTVRPMPIMNC